MPRWSAIRTWVTGPSGPIAALALPTTHAMPAASRAGVIRSASSGSRSRDQQEALAQRCREVGGQQRLAQVGEQLVGDQPRLVGDRVEVVAQARERDRRGRHRQQLLAAAGDAVEPCERLHVAGRRRRALHHARPARPRRGGAPRRRTRWSPPARSRRRPAVRRRRRGGSAGRRRRVARAGRARACRRSSGGRTSGPPGVGRVGVHHDRDAVRHRGRGCPQARPGAGRPQPRGAKVATDGVRHARSRPDPARRWT